MAKQRRRIKKERVSLHTLHTAVAHKTNFHATLIISKNMAEQGAALQSYNNELVKCLDELCEKRNILQKEISHYI